ncbi:MAG: formylglycine-generating enzyme family protein, partial [Chitinispirillaceae bacterium]
MFVRYNRAIIAFIAMMLTCTPLSPDRGRPSDLLHPGMKKILSAGKSFQQGWNNTLASYDEKPGMQSTFTYNYWMDTTEVTQKQYYDVTGKRPVTDSSQYGVGDNYPVYYVSWFDAVLYCNARSRAEHLDTVYMYSGVHPPSGGSVYELTGLRCDVSRDGYRLPTESEWEFAARGASSLLPFSAAADSSYACYYSWFGKNSSGMTHWVAKRLPNSLGLYDMAGNVFEWTNDWKCAYNGTNITNSLGAFKPNNEYEKVIKGGSYNYSLMYLRPSHRSVTYATELSTACEYVGFRCARGVIPNGQYIGQSTGPTNPVYIVAGTNDFQSFMGTSGVRIVFVNVSGNDRTLCYVDFSRMFPTLLEYLDDRNVFLPTISPDGRYVAYCSNDVGQSGPSKITVRSLDSLGSPRATLAPDTAYAPQWWVNPAGDTCIVYTNSACDNGTSAWPLTKTFSQKMSGGKPVVGPSEPHELISDGSYHGGISVDGQYAVTGYRRLMMKNLSANSTGQQLFVSP